MSRPPRSFLLIGMSFADLPLVVGAERAAAITQSVKAGIAADTARFAAAGHRFEVINYGNEETMGRLEEMLREGRYDGVCVGFGIRSNKDFTPLFERVVNTVHTTSPTSKLILNVTPDGTLEAASRQFSELRSAEETSV